MDFPSLDHPPEDDAPNGLDYHHLVRQLEGCCEIHTDERLPALGVRAPRCYVQLGVVLDLLSRLSSCFWGCSGTDHSVEFLATRVVSTPTLHCDLLELATTTNHSRFLGRPERYPT